MFDFSSLLERAISSYLALDPETLKRLSTLSSKVVKLTLTDWNASLYLLPHAHGIRIEKNYPGETHAEISGSSLLFMRMHLADEHSATTLAKQLQITGDIHLAQAFNQILRQADIDWEEPLSQITGDTIAHQVGNLARGFKRWRRQATQGLGTTITEYLQEEANQLPSRHAVESFYTQIQTLRDDVERLALRL